MGHGWTRVELAAIPFLPLCEGLSPTSSWLKDIRLDHHHRHIRDLRLFGLTTIEKGSRMDNHHREMIVQSSRSKNGCYFRFSGIPRKASRAPKKKKRVSMWPIKFVRLWITISKQHRWQDITFTVQETKKGGGVEDKVILESVSGSTMLR